MPRFLTGFIRQHLPLSAFTLLYVIGFSAWSFAGGNTEFVFYSVVMVLAILGVLYMHHVAVTANDLDPSDNTLRAALRKGRTWLEGEDGSDQETELL